MTVVLVVFGVWLAVGLVLSVRSEVRRAGREGRGRTGAVVVGAALAVPDLWIVGVPVLAALVWAAMT